MLPCSTIYVHHSTCSLKRLGHQVSIVTITKILISCSEGDFSVFFACKLRYCTGVWPFGRIERVRNSKCSMFNELERNKIIIYTVPIIRMFE